MPTTYTPGTPFTPYADLTQVLPLPWVALPVTVAPLEELSVAVADSGVEIVPTVDSGAV